jgi:NADH-quinone oxidoreductase subunit N
MSVIIVILLTAILVLFLHIFEGRQWVNPLAILGLSLSFIILCLENNSLWGDYSSMIYMTQFAKVFTGTAIIFTILVFFINQSKLKLEEDTNNGDKLGLVLFSLCGAILLFTFTNITMLFLGIEILSIPLYVIASSSKHDLHSNEAGLKYFLMGSFATSIILFGMALIFGATNSLDIMTISEYFSQAEISKMAALGAFFVGIGFFFKVAAIPFHFWTPDVYEGTPSIWATYFATVVKIASFGAFFRLYILLGNVDNSPLYKVLVLIIILTVIVGTLTALVQENAKRMIAYSSIVNSGFLLMFFLNPSSDILSYFGLFILGYGLATIGIFSAIVYLESIGNSNGFEGFDGLGKSQPLFSLGVAICLLSLAGIPLTVGFLGKFYLLMSLSFDQWWMILLVIASSIISIVYYFRIFNGMYFSNKKASAIVAPEVVSPYLNFVVGFCALSLIIIGLFPDFYLNIFQ